MTQSSASSYQPQPSGDPAPTSDGTKPPPHVPAGPVSGPATYVIQPGDHLWGVATRVVAERKGSKAEDLSTRDIGRYWVRLIELNRSRLHSGDPNVVHIGEKVLLPAWEGS